MTAQASDPIEIASYDPVARSVHWLVAALAITVVSLGWAIPGSAREGDTREWVLLLHRSVGLLILALMLFRVFWRNRHAPPPLPDEFPAFEAWAAHADHVLLYVMFLVMPLSGYLNAAAAGHSVNFFGLVTIPPLLPASERLSQAAIALHLAGQFAVYGLVVLHVAAALMHRFVRRNQILDRMLPNSAASNRTPDPLPHLTGEGPRKT